MPTYSTDRCHEDEKKGKNRSLLMTAHKSGLKSVDTRTLCKDAIDPFSVPKIASMRKFSRFFERDTFSLFSSLFAFHTEFWRVALVKEHIVC